MLEHYVIYFLSIVAFIGSLIYAYKQSWILMWGLEEFDTGEFLKQFFLSLFFLSIVITFIYAAIYFGKMLF